VEFGWDLRRRKTINKLVEKRAQVGDTVGGHDTSRDNPEVETLITDLTDPLKSDTVAGITTRRDQCDAARSCFRDEESLSTTEHQQLLVGLIKTVKETGRIESDRFGFSNDLLEPVREELWTYCIWALNDGIQVYNPEPVYAVPADVLEEFVEYLLRAVLTEEIQPTERVVNTAANVLAKVGLFRPEAVRNTVNSMTAFETPERFVETLDRLTESTGEGRRLSSWAHQQALTVVVESTEYSVPLDAIHEEWRSQIQQAGRRPKAPDDRCISGADILFGLITDRPTFDDPLANEADSRTDTDTSTGSANSVSSSNNVAAGSDNGLDPLLLEAFGMSPTSSYGDIEPIVWRFLLGANPAVSVAERQRRQTHEMEALPELVSTYGPDGLLGVMRTRASTVSADEIVTTLLESLPRSPEDPRWLALGRILRDSPELVHPDQIATILNAISAVDLTEPDQFRLTFALSNTLDTVRTTIDHRRVSQLPIGRVASSIAEQTTQLLDQGYFHSSSTYDLVSLPFCYDCFPESCRRHLLEELFRALEEGGNRAYHGATALSIIHDRSSYEPSQDQLRTVYETFVELLETETEIDGVNPFWDAYPRLVELYKPIADQDGVRTPRSVLVDFGKTTDRPAQVAKYIRKNGLDEPEIAKNDLQQLIDSVLWDEQIALEERTQFVRQLLKSPRGLPQDVLVSALEQCIRINRRSDHPEPFTLINVCEYMESARIEPDQLSTTQLAYLLTCVADFTDRAADGPLVRAMSSVLSDAAIDALLDENPDVLAQLHETMVEIISDPYSPHMQMAAMENLRRLPEPI